MNFMSLLNEKSEIQKFIQLSHEEYQSKWDLMTYKSGDIVCELGGIYEYFYVIIEGCVNIQHSSEKGMIYSQNIYTPGRYFGELEIFESRPYACDIVALSPLKLMCLPKKYFIRWIKEDPELLFYLYKKGCEGAYNLSLKASQDTLYSLTFRLCNYLIMCREDVYMKAYNDIFLNRNYLSQKFVVTKRSINRVLKSLQDQKLIRISDEQIEIIDLKKLIKLRDDSMYF